MSNLEKIIWSYGCKVYTDNVVDLGTSEYKIYSHLINDKPCNILAIRGTDEKADWKENFNLWSKYGFKKSGVEAAEEIKNHIMAEDPNIVLDYVVTHSKSGPTGDYLTHAYKNLFRIKQCFMFNPARGRRYWNREFTNMVTVFRNKKDPVSEILGFVGFGQPNAKTVNEKGKGLFMSWKKNHAIGLWEEYFERS